ncbi:MAG TPA: helix-turn-helix transcriptional regulator [Longimicrobium sp.]|nr:helix-turn-helix transcriptional regulator [Longimicrobium sp.]
MKLAALLTAESIGGSEFDAYADQRRIELLRRAVLDELRRNPGQEALAAEIGVTRTVLRKLIAQVAVPSPETLARIEHSKGNRPPVHVHYGSVVIATAVRELPGSLRAGARHEMARALLRIYRASAVVAPAWLVDEADETPAPDDGVPRPDRPRTGGSLATGARALLDADAEAVRHLVWRGRGTR